MNEWKAYRAKSTKSSVGTSVQKQTDTLIVKVQQKGLFQQTQVLVNHEYSTQNVRKREEMLAFRRPVILTEHSSILMKAYTQGHKMNIG